MKTKFHCLFIALVLSVFGNAANAATVTWVNHAYKAP